jgi:hypothetical protein
MKNNKIYIIAAICLIAGLALFTVGFFMTGFDITKLSSEGKYEEKSFVSSKIIDAIVIDDSNTGVAISSSADDKIHITYYENDKSYYEITERDDGTLSIAKKENRKWFDYIFVFNFQNVTLSIEIPANKNSKITAATSNNTINITDINASEMRLNTSNGTIDVKNVTVSGKIDTNTSNGGIYISDSAIAGEIICGSSNGPVTIDTVECESLKAETSNNSITLKSIISNNSINAHSSNGGINLDAIKFGTALSLQTSNNSVNGSIAGSLADYSVTTKTSNGKSNLPENITGGEKTIYIKTSNGNINIDFLG